MATKSPFYGNIDLTGQLQSERRDGCAERRGGFQNFLTNDDIITSNNTRKEGKAITKISSPPPMHFIVFA